MNKGGYIWHKKNDVTAYQWRDSKNVCLNPTTTNQTEEQVDVERMTATRQKLPVKYPIVVEDYNAWIGK